jgi:hypothetical protein
MENRDTKAAEAEEEAKKTKEEESEENPVGEQ